MFTKVAFFNKSAMTLLDFKGVFAKNERGYRLTAKTKRF